MGRTDVEIEAAILWPPNVKSDSLEKTLMKEIKDDINRWKDEESIL